MTKHHAFLYEVSTYIYIYIYIYKFIYLFSIGMNYLVYICSQHVLIFKGEDQYSYGHHFHAKRKLPTSLLRQNST